MWVSVSSMGLHPFPAGEELLVYIFCLSVGNVLRLVWDSKYSCLNDKVVRRMRDISLTKAWVRGSQLPHGSSGQEPTSPKTGDL